MSPSDTTDNFLGGRGVRDKLSLCSPGCPGTHSVDQVGLELRNPPASASQVLGLKVCATTAWLCFYVLTSLDVVFYCLSGGLLYTHTMFLSKVMLPT